MRWNVGLQRLLGSNFPLSSGATRVPVIKADNILQVTEYYEAPPVAQTPTNTMTEEYASLK